MTDSRFRYDWRAPDPLPGFASRVVSRLDQEGSVAQAAGQRRAAPGRRASPLVLLGLAAILISGAALGRLPLQDVLAPPLLTDVQEAQPTSKVRGTPVTLQLKTPGARMEPTAPRPSPQRRPAVPALPAVAAPSDERSPEPLHYPPCHCSSGAIVCSCVD